MALTEVINSHGQETMIDVDFDTPFSTPYYPRLLPIDLTVAMIMPEDLLEKLINECFPAYADETMPYELKKTMFLKFNSKWSEETKSWKSWRYFKDGPYSNDQYEINLCTNIIRTERVRNKKIYYTDKNKLPRTLVYNPDASILWIFTIYEYWMQHYKRHVNVGSIEPINHFRKMIDERFAKMNATSSRRRRK